VIGSGGTVLRFDPAAGTVTSLPGVAGLPDFRTGYSWAMAFAPSGDLYVNGDYALHRIDLAAGTMVALPRLIHERGPIDTMAFDANGTLFYPSIESSAVRSRSPDGTVNSVAGLSGGGFAGDGGHASLARFRWPRAVVLDASGNIYISDQVNARIRKITRSTGIITTIVGTGSQTYNGENLLASQTNVCPGPLAVDTAQNLLFFDNCGQRLRQLNASTGRVNTIAGNGTFGSSGDGGPGTQASLGNIGTFAVDASGNIYLPDPGHHRMRMVSGSTGIITTVLGNGTTYCNNGGPATNACLAFPEGLAIDAAGDLLIADDGNHRIRKVIRSTRAIEHVFQFANYDMAGIDVDSTGKIYLSGGLAAVYVLTPSTGAWTRFAGNGNQGFFGDGGLATSAHVNTTSDVAFDAAGNLFISDMGNHRIRRVDAVTRIITTYAGTGSATGALGDGGLATSASLSSPGALGFDPAGNLLFVDGNHFRLRKVDKTTGVITTIAGNGDGSYVTSGDGGPATSASIGTKPVFAIDSAGHIFLGWTSRLRRIDAFTGIIDVVPEPPGGLVTPEGLRILAPLAMTFDADGYLYVGDGAEQVVFRVLLPAAGPDTSPPVIDFNLSGTQGPGGWYRSDVAVNWTVTDLESPVSASTGCTASTVSEDTDGLTISCTATSAGGTAERSVIVRRDTIAPVLTFGALSPAANEFGWHGVDVSVPFETSDALSGVFSQSTSSPAVVTGTGTNMHVQITVTDAAGNTATFLTPQVRIDRTVPIVTPNVSGTLGRLGWYTGDVQVTWTLTDADSPVVSSQFCEASNVTSDTSGVTFTCYAQSAGGSGARSITVMRDATPPSLTFGALSPAADAAGWHNGDVRIPFQITDNLSGAAPYNGLNPVVITGTGPSLRTLVTVTDNAGNTTSLNTPDVNIERTPPTVTPVVTGTLGNDGWYTSDVHVSWSTTGFITSMTGCATYILGTDSLGTTYSCVATSAAGTATASVTVKRDATPPQIAFGALTPAPDAAGWNSTDVSSPYTATDTFSGVASASRPSPLVITGEGTGLRTAVTVTDGAGNSITLQTPPVNIDRSAVAVTVTPVVTGAIGNEGWYRSDIQVSWAITGNVISSSGCASNSVVTDTAGVTFTCSVISGAGSTSNTVTVKRDATPPVLTWRAATPAPNAAGWNRANVSFPFNAPTDARSGVATVSAASPLVLSTEGSGVTGAVTVTDRAGNVAVFTTTPRNIDKTAPVVTIATPLQNKQYGLYATLNASFSCVDAVSGTTNCSGTTENGATLNTRAMNGYYTFRVTSADVAGNSVTRSNSWTVAGSFLMEGFLAPMANDPTFNLVTAGTRVPMRFRLPDRNGGYVADTTAFDSFTVATERCLSNVATLNDVANGGAGLSFDAATSTYTYNWDTDASWAGTCRNIKLRLIDGSRHTLMFKFQ
jgi:sugar lactone lactonase YvrE